MPHAVLPEPEAARDVAEVRLDLRVDVRPEQRLRAQVEGVRGRELAARLLEEARVVEDLGGGVGSSSQSYKHACMYIYMYIYIYTLSA